MTPALVPMPGHPERGAAVIIVMFVFAVAAVMAIAMLSRQQTDIARTGNLLGQAQAYQYALAAEELARQTLAESSKLTPDVDYRGQRWASLDGGLPVEGGIVLIHLEDLQARFNLNTLMGRTIAPPVFFGNLLRSLGIRADASSLAEGLSQSAAVQNGFNVAPRRIPLLDGASALRAGGLMGARDYAALAPYVTALPDAASLLNVNTAPDILLHAYIQQDAVYERLAGLRGARGFLTQQQLDVIGMKMVGMGVRSNYFGLTAQVRLGSDSLTIRSVIRRLSGPTGLVHISVISRDLGGP